MDLEDGELADIAEELTPFHSEFAYNLTSVVS
jgi:hypothetical protein